MTNGEILTSTIFLRKFLENPDSGPLSKEFFDRFHPGIIAAIKKQRIKGKPIQDADAEDISSGLLLKFFEKGYFQKFVFDGKLKFYAWLNKSVRHAFLEFARKQNRKRDGWNLDNPAEWSQIEPVIDRWGNDVREIYERELELGEQAYGNVKEKFEEKSIRAFHMQVIENRPGSEVAEILAMKITAAYKAKERVARALKDEFLRLRTMDSGI